MPPAECGERIMTDETTPDGRRATGWPARRGHDDLDGRPGDRHAAGRSRCRRGEGRKRRRGSDARPCCADGGRDAQYRHQHLVRDVQPEQALDRTRPRSPGRSRAVRSPDRPGRRLHHQHEPVHDHQAGHRRHDPARPQPSTRSRSRSRPGYDRPAGRRPGAGHDGHGVRRHALHLVPRRKRALRPTRCAQRRHHRHLPARRRPGSTDPAQPHRSG